MDKLLLLSNPRRRRSRRKHARKTYRHMRIFKNPRRSRSVATGSGSTLSNIVSVVLPISAGFAGGLVIPKLLKWTDSKAIIAPAVAGIVTIFAGRFIIGRKFANLAGAGMLGAAVVMLADKFFFQKNAQTGGLLKDDSLPMLADIPTGNLADVETMSAGQDDAGMIEDETPGVEIAEGEELASNMYNRFGKYDE